jgi:death-on-curing protein
LADGNERLALGAVIAFYGINGRRLTLTGDAANDLVMRVAVGRLDSVEAIAPILEKATEPRP